MAGNLCYKKGNGSLAYKKGGNNLIYKSDKVKPSWIDLIFTASQSTVGPVGGCDKVHSAIITMDNVGDGMSPFYMNVSNEYGSLTFNLSYVTSSCQDEASLPELGCSITAIQQSHGKLFTIQKRLPYAFTQGFEKYTIKIDSDGILIGLE